MLRQVVVVSATTARPFGPDDLVDVGAVDVEHVSDHLQARAGIVSSSAPVIAVLPAGSPTLNRCEALRHWRGIPRHQLQFPRASPTVLGG